MLYISFMSIDLEIAARARREAGGAKKLAIPAVMRSLGDNTIASALARHRGEGPGFGLMRLALATLICFYHSIHLGGGASAVSGQNTQAALAGFTGLTGPTRPFLVVLVPMFFALSGFLVTGSAFRVRVTSTFLAFRALRIFPALSVEVALSALILGRSSRPCRGENTFRTRIFSVTSATLSDWLLFICRGSSKPIG
jgi:peptidoglycan/LPS O-acetylase OafA/YrhL